MARQVDNSKRVTLNMLTSLVQRCNELSSDRRKYQLVIEDATRPHYFYVHSVLDGRRETIAGGTYSKRDLHKELVYLVNELTNHNGHKLIEKD